MCTCKISKCKSLALFLIYSVPHLQVKERPFLCYTQWFCSNNNNNVKQRTGTLLVVKKKIKKGEEEKPHAGKLRQSFSVFGLASSPISFYSL